MRAGVTLLKSNSKPIMTTAPTIEEVKAALDVPGVWRWLNLPGVPGKQCPSPFRPDKNPSFSVFAGGSKWRDHATGEGGDVLDFLKIALGCPLPAALAWAGERMGHFPPASPPSPPRSVPASSSIPALSEGTAEEIQALSALRGIRAEALAEAQRLGLLRFARWRGRVAYVITDAARRVAEGRRLDGLPWPGPHGAPGYKAHAWGAGKAWPLNLGAVFSVSKVAFCEGGPDLLAAVALIQQEQRADVCAVTMLGAGNGIAAEALSEFRGKTVRLFPHADEEGLRAAERWATALRAAGAARVDGFDFSGLSLTDGTPGKDLNDYLRCGADAWEAYPKFRNSILP